MKQLVLVFTAFFALGSSRLLAAELGLGVICGQTNGVQTVKKERSVNVNLGFIHIQRETTTLNSNSAGGEFILNFSKPVAGSVNEQGQVEISGPMLKPGQVVQQTLSMGKDGVLKVEETKKSKEKPIKKLSKTYGFETVGEYDSKYAVVASGTFACVEMRVVNGRIKHAFGSGLNLQQAISSLEALRSAHFNF